MLCGELDARDIVEDNLFELRTVREIHHLLATVSERVVVDT